MYPALLFKSITVRSLYWYFAHFAGVGIGMIGVWKLALRLTHSTQLAWLAVLALHLNVAISTDARNQNDNYLLVMLWPWLFYLFIRAGFDDPLFWIPFGMLAGLAMMAKFSTLALLWSIFVLTLSTPTLRKSYRQLSIYYGIGLFLLTVVPNPIWLWQHHFVAIHRLADDALSTMVAIVVSFISVLLFFALWSAGIRFRWPPYRPARSAVICMLLPTLPILVYLMIYPTSNPRRVAEWLRSFGILGPPLFVLHLRHTELNVQKDFHNVVGYRLHDVYRICHGQGHQFPQYMLSREWCRSSRCQSARPLALSLQVPVVLRWGKRYFQYGGVLCEQFSGASQGVVRSQAAQRFHAGFACCRGASTRRTTHGHPGNLLRWSRLL